MKLSTGLLAGIGLIGGACVLPLAPATAANPAGGASGQPNAGSANTPGTDNSGVVHTSSSGPAPGAPASSMSGSQVNPPSMGTTGSTYGTSSTMGSTTNMSSDSIRQLQQALNDNGENLNVDGVMGPQTERALRDYQQKNGLQASGMLDQPTRQKLNIGG